MAIPTASAPRQAAIALTGLAFIVVAFGCASNGGGSVFDPESIDAGVCDPDPLRTGATDRAHTDDFDCLILQFAQQYREPDAMIIKAIIRVESGFQVDAMGCTAPCGTPSGWSASEVKCLGMMQIVAACSPEPNDLGMLSNGHPNMSLDTSAGSWVTSIFNPAVNIERGVRAIAGNRVDVVERFPGCTEEQYTLMAIGNYNHYGSTTACDAYNTEYCDAVLKYYHQYSAAAGWSERSY